MSKNEDETKIDMEEDDTMILNLEGSDRFEPLIDYQAEAKLAPEPQPKNQTATKTSVPQPPPAEAKPTNENTAPAVKGKLNLEKNTVRLNELSNWKKVNPLHDALNRYKERTSYSGLTSSSNAKHEARMQRRDNLEKILEGLKSKDPGKNRDSAHLKELYQDFKTATNKNPDKKSILENPRAAVAEARQKIKNLLNIGASAQARSEFKKAIKSAEANEAKPESPKPR